MDVFSTAILIIPCVWLGIAVQNRILLLGYLSLSLCYAVLQVRLCFEHGQYQFLLPKSQTREPLGINGGLGNLGVSVMQLVARWSFLYPYLPFSASMAYRRPRFGDVAGECRMDLGAITGDSTIAAWSGMNDIASSRASIATSCQCYNACISGC